MILIKATSYPIKIVERICSGVFVMFAANHTKVQTPHDEIDGQEFKNLEQSVAQNKQVHIPGQKWNNAKEKLVSAEHSVLRFVFADGA